MTKPMKATTVAAPETPPYLPAACVAAATLVLYVATLAPTAQFWDTPEYIAAAYVLGIPHPPGNPLFVILAHVWGLVPWMHGYAARINLFAAVTSALATGFWFLIAERWLRAIVPPAWLRRAVAAAGALVAATAFTVWNQSVVNEKVYTLSLLSIALVLWLVVRWADLPAGSRRDHRLLLIVYLLALTATNHLMGLLVVPAVLVYVLYSDPKIFLSPRFLAWSAAAVALGVSLWAFLVVRAPHFPAINEGEPTTWAALREVLNRTQYGKPPLADRQSDFGSQIAMWWQYFTWQWGRDWAAGVQRGLALLFGGLGVLGAWRQLRADRRAGLAMLALTGTLIPALVFYLNFKYRFGSHPAQWTLDEVRERDYFFICSFAVWGLWVAIGLAAAMERVQRALAARVSGEGRRWALATPVLALALIPLLGNRLAASRRGETLARDFAVDMLQSAVPYSVLITAGDNDTFPLWFAQEVEHVRQDVTVLNAELAKTDWYDRQIERRPLATFDSASAPPLWRTRSYPRPAGPLWDLSLDTLDRIQLAYDFPEPRTMTLGGLTVTVDPRRLGRDYLDRADVLILRAIQDQFGKRPILFARTTADYAERLGLGGHLVDEGMVRELVASPAAGGDSIQQTQFGLVNVPRLRALVSGVYHAHSAAWHRPLGWMDVPSQNILVLYASLYQETGLLLAKSEPDTATRMLALADSAIANTTYGRRRQAE